MYRTIRVAASFLILVLGFAATPAQAQKRDTVIVAGPAVVLEAPRGDSQVLGEVAAGTLVNVIDRWEDWYFVSADAGDAVAWQGWMNARSLQLPGGYSVDRIGNGRFMARAFGQAGGLLFTAKNSFDTLLGRSMSAVYGVGGQVVFPNGVFAQVGIDRVQATGTRALVSGEQVFTLPIANRVTITPVQVTAGYRAAPTHGVAVYVGGGMGWHTLEEDSPTVPGSDRMNSRHLGYHALLGAELPVLRFFGVAGELQWATVPKALGGSGLSAVYDEKDLGGTTFRVKLLVGY